MLAMLWGGKEPPFIGVATQEISTENPDKTLWPSYTTLGHVPKGLTHYSTDVCSAMIAIAVFTVARK